MRNSTSIMTLLIAATLIISSTISAISISDSSTNSDIEKKYHTKVDKVVNNLDTPPSVDKERENTILDDSSDNTRQYVRDSSIANDRGEPFYASNLHNDPNDNLVWFNPDTPGIFNNIADISSTDFLAGGCFVEDTWWACEYSAASNSNVWTIDETNGDMTLVGASGAGLNGLAYAPSTTTLYGCDSVNLYTINTSNGAATLVGAMSNPGEVMIGIACDNSGNMYGVDIGDDNLYSIDTGTGAATIIGALGIDLSYAQDIAYDKNTDILYSTGYKGSGAGGGALYTLNLTTGAATKIGDFPIGNLGCPSEVAGFAIPYILPEHDVRIKSINAPVSGNAGVFTPEVMVHNRGTNPETDVPVNMKIAKKNITVIFDENFEGSWGPYGDNPPAGWTILDYGDGGDGWNNNDWHKYEYSTWNSNTARVYYSPIENQDEWLITPTINCTGKINVHLEFQHYYNYLSGDYAAVEGSTDNGTNWAFPIANYTADDNQVRTYGISSWADGESQVKIRFRYVGNNAWYWYVDNVKVYDLKWDSEYNETVYVDLSPDENLDVILPDWIPSDLNHIENVDIEYFVEAETQLIGDENPSNDYISQEITLHYGLYHDVGVTSIISPTTGDAQSSFTPEIIVENFGQNDENVSVNFQINKVGVAAEILEEGFESYTPEEKVWPPTGWTLVNDSVSRWTYGTTSHTGDYNAETDIDVSGSADCWLISNLTTIPLSDAKLSYYYRGGYSSYQVAFEINVSTTGTDPADFTGNQLYDSGLFSLPDYNDPWGDNTIDISAYAGQDIYIGFHCYYQGSTSYELQLDDIWLGSQSIVELFPEESFDPAPFPPTGWTVYNVDGGDQWERYGSTYPHTGSWCARCRYDTLNDDWLVTDSYVVPGGGGNFSFWARSYYSTTAEAFEVYYSTTGNTISDFENGTLLESTSVQSTTYILFDYTSNMTGEAGNTLWFAVRYIGTNDWYLYVDDFTFPDGTTEGFEMMFPPVGWTIESHAPGANWTQGTAHDGGCAFADEVASLEQDEWLITPKIDCTGATDLHLTFWHDFYYSSTSGDSFGEIYGSIDNGTTWTYLIANYTNDSSNEIADKDYDISSWADGQSQVKIRFRFYSTNLTSAYDDWAIDDVWIGTIGTPITTWNEGFEEIIPANWPPAGWTHEVVTGTDADNEWDASDGTSTHPSGVNPYGGTWMAQYDSYYISSGNSARLYSYAMNFSSYGALGYQLRFYMNHDDGYSSNDDRVDIQISTDGSNWATEDTFSRYDASDPGWLQHIVDLSSYAAETEVYVGFLGISEYGNSIYIDNITVSTVPFILEYNETVNVTVPAGGKASVNVAFPDWSPSDWNIASNTDIEYKIEASTQLANDTNASNDYQSEYITLYYPYLHDIGVTEILSPNSGIGQTFTPEITIENFGQNSENSFEATLIIGAYEPIGRSIYDFEYDDGGFVPSADWDPIGDWEWTDSYDVSNYVGSHTPPPTAHSGDGLWGTVIYDDYTNAGGTSFLKKIVDFSGISGAYMSFYSWADIFGSFDYGTVKVNGDELLRIDTYNPTEWTYEEIDLSDYDGMTNVEISFDLYATTVVEYAGWYIDDVFINDIETEFIEEYNETVFIADPIEIGGTMNITFPDWTPDYFLTGQSGHISYDIIACTDLAIDENGENDCMTKGIVLDYIHDVGTVEITEPSFEPGEELEPGVYPVEAIVRNYGTYSEDFSTSASIWKITYEKIDELVYYDEVITTGLEIDTEETLIFNDWDVDEQGEYRLDVETQLFGDDDPGNDLKSLTIIIAIPDTEPPVTTIDIDGTMGDNNWFVSDVVITLTATDEGSGVKETWYRIDSGDWIEYTEPFNYDEDGEHTIEAYSVDNADNVEDPPVSEDFKIDQTPPTIELTRENIGVKKYKFIAEVDDATSDVARVEFYLDDELQETITEPPYEWIWQGLGNHTVTAIVYDNAGNSATDSATTSYNNEYLQSQNNNLATDNDNINVVGI